MTHQAPSRQDHCSESEQAKAPEAISDFRRRLLIAGGSIAPVVLTLASRPVLGADCVSPSATLSSALSHKEGSVGECSGLSQGFWKNANSWPIPKDSPFHRVFSAGSRPGTSFFKSLPYSHPMSMTLYEVLSLDGRTDSEKLASHIICAYLNILSGRVSEKVITEAKLKEIWLEWATNGSYAPFAGATAWDGAQIKLYLTNNHLA